MTGGTFQGRHHRDARLQAHQDLIPLDDDDFMVRGGCAGCGFHVFGAVRRSLVRTCEACKRALCLVCFAGAGAQGFPTDQAAPCLACASKPEPVP